MKTCLAVFAFAAGLMASPLFAQDFEGTIRWTFSFDITDSSMKQQIADAQKRMADPEMQAKMQEAKAAMDSPEMQAIMAQKPQMKAMMEKQLAMMNAATSGGGNPMADLFPKGITVKAKGRDVLTLVEGGMAPSETLALGATHTTYLIDRQARSYSVQPAAAAAVTSKPAYTVKKTSETAVILGHPCTKYLVAATGEPPASYIVWTSTDFKGFDASRLSKLRVGQDSSADFMRQLDGVPLKLEITSAEAKITMVATAIKAETLPSSLFQIPAGFTQTTTPAP